MNATSHAELARAKKMSEARDMGISDALISDLVEGFYGGVRRDALLGPIFDRHIEDWGPHLAKMKDFWASITMESGRFRGSPMAKHIAIGSLDETHFAHWLSLWRAAVEKIVPDARAQEVFLSSAERIASSLLTGIQIHEGGLSAARQPMPASSGR